MHTRVSAICVSTFASSNQASNSGLWLSGHVIDRSTITSKLTSHPRRVSVCLFHISKPGCGAGDSYQIQQSTTWPCDISRLLLHQWTNNSKSSVNTELNLSNLSAASGLCAQQPYLHFLTGHSGAQATTKVGFRIIFSGTSLAWSLVYDEFIHILSQLLAKIVCST